MTVVSSGLIQVFLTDYEADILQAALGMYRGPYAPGSELTRAEVERSEKMVVDARGLMQELQEELMRRSNEQDKSQMVEDLVNDLCRRRSY